jgi:hypothetical protein
MDAQSADSPPALDTLKADLLATLTSAVRDLDADKLSEESFQSYQAVLQVVLDVIRKHREMLVGQRHHTNLLYAGSAILDHRRQQ